MPFLPPNQQCQRNEGTACTSNKTKINDGTEQASKAIWQKAASPRVVSMSFAGVTGPASKQRMPSSGKTV